MGVMRRLLARPGSVETSAAKTERRSLTGAQVIDLLTGGAPTSTGISVTPENSLRYTAVLACVRVLAEGVASLPCILYERQADGGKARATRHGLYGLLHNIPNPVQTAFEFYEVGMAQCLLWGNFYAEIDWDMRGQVRALWPLPAWDMTPMWSRDGKVYELRLENGGARYFQDYQILHVPGFGFDGTAGRSMISLAREAVALGLAAQQFGGAFFGNGARPGVVLEHPAQLSDEAYAHLQNSWNQQHQGLSNAQRVAILEEGMKLQTLGVPPEDAQFLETRQFQRSEIAAIYRVPPHMIGDLERATFSNIEQQSQDFLSNSLQPWLRRWEQRLVRSLLIGAERQRYYVEYLVDALLRGDTQTRYAAYAVGRQWGWLSVNDIRARENMNPVDGGEVYLQPMNMVEAGGELDGSDGPDGSDGLDGSEGEEGEGRGLLVVAEVRAAGGTVAGGRLPAAEVRAAGRRRLAEVHREALEDAGQRVINRECNDILNAARRMLARSPEEFYRWLDGFIAEHHGFVRDRLWATAWALMRLAADAARAEAAEAGYDADLAAEAAVEQWSRAVNSGHATGWVEQLRQSIENRVAAAVDAEADALEEVEDLLATRRENRAASWARDEAVSLVGAVTVMVFGAVGVQRLMWATSGAEDCPYCEALNGVIVGINEYFVPAGGEVAPEGQQALRPHHATRHGPLHDGCDCTVVIG